MTAVTGFIQHINEGVYDKGIFKAFFLAGGPASGKSFVSARAFAGSGLKVVNSDTTFEKYLKKANLSLNMPAYEKYFRDKLRAGAKAVTATTLDSYVQGRLGLIIDSTARDYDAIARQYQMLSLLGYDCYMIFVQTALDVALERQKQRERQMPNYILVNSWKETQSHKSKYKRLFGSNYVEVENNKSNLELITITMNKVARQVMALLNAPIKSFTARRWIVNRLKEKRR